MAKIHFVDHSGETRTIDVENGATVMEAAIRNAIPGIEAECGGACACATCHVYVDEAWREKVGAPSPMEEDMLDFGFDVRPNSRLSCQIKVSDALDGLVVSTPERQAWTAREANIAIATRFIARRFRGDASAGASR
jgi:2Fe-2S ferredoxin